MPNIESLVQGLPDPEAAERIFKQFGEKHPGEVNKLLKNKGLLSDILTIFSYSPLLAATLLQNPSYVFWLNRHRSESGIRDKTELLESLARFSLTNSEIEPHVLLTRFRRRELLRIFLHDIRRLVTIAEITEEISNLADAVLEYALGLARQELDNRYGIPLETDNKGRAKPASFCIVSLGKLGSKELNYSSDIDLLFIYSAEGETSGKGTKGSVTNREYFVKLAEFIVRLVGHQTGEGAAYRVDLRLRPHGRVGALALSAAETIRYYQTEARAWERQVLIRSRASAGDGKIFKKFFSRIESAVFSTDETVENALENVRLSKEKINLEHQTNYGFDVKLGIGGIREIEFIAQALQLAYGGDNEWLRAPHTLISLARLADRKLISQKDLTALFAAYEFLRQTEHLLQMENGLQTHTVTENPEKRVVLARKMRFDSLAEFDRKLEKHSKNVNRIFSKIFSSKISKSVFEVTSGTTAAEIEKFPSDNSPVFATAVPEETFSFEKLSTPDILSKISVDFSHMLSANADLIEEPSEIEGLKADSFLEILSSQVEAHNELAGKLSSLRQSWSRVLSQILLLDVAEKTPRKDSKYLQTKLAEASIETALRITRSELEKRLSIHMSNFPLAVLGLGKLGGGGLDYQSDLDLILVYDDELPLNIKDFTHAEFYSRAVEIFVNTLSGFTRDGNLYRVDLRLRPDGKNGTTSIGKTSFLNYLRSRAAIWEWLAYVKLRAVGGDFGLADYIEEETRRILHERAFELKKDNSQNLSLVEETRRIRQRLEDEKTGPGKRGQEIDIKFGAGGMLDVYFAVRFLQLRDHIPDTGENRSTFFTLKKLSENRSLSDEDFENFTAGYEFLSALDHQLRLTVGRSTRLPLANRRALEIIALRIGALSVSDMLEKLTFHRLNIRASYESVLII